MSQDSLKETNENHDSFDPNLCYQCGTCSGGCPVSQLIPEYNARKIVKDKKEKKIDNKNKFIWYCSTCYICYERCPQGVKPIEIIQSITNFLSKNGLAPISLIEGNKKVLASGRTSEITRFTEKKRDGLGLPKLKADVSLDYKKIAKITGLTELVE
jgi:heterodisulfide reductase subunit C